MNFNSRGAWGSSTQQQSMKPDPLKISIPVVRGGVQHPNVNIRYYDMDFNSRGAWGSSTGTLPEEFKDQVISIPVVRGGVQLDRRTPSQRVRHDFNSRGAWGSSTNSGWQRRANLPISIPVVRGGVQRQAFILPDLSGFQSLISRIANKPKTNTTQ